MADKDTYVTDIKDNTNTTSDTQIEQQIMK